MYFEMHFENVNIEIHENPNMKMQENMHFYIGRFYTYVTYKEVNMRRDISEAITFLMKGENNMYNKAELARRFNCDPRTIDRYIKISTGQITPSPSKRVYKRKLEGFEDIVIDKVDRYGCNAMSVYKFILEKGYDGKYSTVAAFVKKHKDSELKKATIRFETSPGLQAQVDWKENMCLVNRKGERFEFNIFLMVLGYSRYKYIELTSDRSQTTLFNCMSNAFKHFQGVPNEILFDNMKTVVDHARSTFTEPVLNSKFEAYAKESGFIPITCRPYRPQTKGKVESLAKLMDRLLVYNEEFSTWEELKTITQNFMEDINNEVSQGINEIPIERFKKEKEYFLPLPKNSILDKYANHHDEHKTYIVNKESLVKYEGKKYSVPTCYIGERLTVKKYNDKLYFYYMDEFIVCHDVSSKPYNYRFEDAVDILKSDAMKHRTDEDIASFVNKTLFDMDKIGGP